MARGILGTTFFSFMFSIFLTWPVPAHCQDEKVIDLGSRRELFVDRFLIDKLDNAHLRLHEPQRVTGDFPLNMPWEGVFAGAYASVVKDGPTYRLYYRGNPGGSFECTCLAESKDGSHWTRPELGLVEFKGSKKNNIILANLPECHNFSVLLDTKPGISGEARYKALGGTGRRGLIAYGSADGIHWKKLRDEAVITKGAFDSQNVAFYSESEKCYVSYFRIFTKGVRSIARCTSPDFLTWTDPVPMDFGDTPAEHLYTNQTTPYFRAPHLYVALPSRFMNGQDAVPAEQIKASGVDPSYQGKGAGFNDMPFMTSRGGNSYQRTFLETFIKPGIGMKNWTSRANYPAHGIVPTPDSSTHLSIYVTKEIGYPSIHVARYALRYDGFASVHAPYQGGRLLTRIFRFAGDKLTINYTTSAPGSIQVEIQDAAGKAIAGYGLADCKAIVGDEIERVVSWKGGNSVQKIAGQPVRLLFVMKAADLYSLKFE